VVSPISTGTPQRLHAAAVAKRQITIRIEDIKNSLFFFIIPPWKYYLKCIAHDYTAYGGFI
jgi:hypothetical protein